MGVVELFISIPNWVLLYSMYSISLLMGVSPLPVNVGLRFISVTTRAAISKMTNNTVGHSPVKSFMKFNWVSLSKFNKNKVHL